MNIDTLHPLHGAAAGLATAAVAKAFGFDNTGAVVAGAVVGGGAWAYMATYGHALPWAGGASAIKSDIPPGGSPATPPTTATNVWSDAQNKAFVALWEKSAADRRAAAAKTVADTKAVASKKQSIPQFFSPLSALF